MLTGQEMMMLVNPGRDGSSSQIPDMFLIKIPQN